MNAAITLAQPGQQAAVGDLLKAHIFFDEKLGGSGDGWEIVSESGGAWVPAGAVTASAASLRAVPAEGNATKLEFDAMVHQPGPLVIGPLKIRNQVSKEEYDVPAFQITGINVNTGTKPPEELPWLLSSMSFGGWDWALIGIFTAILAVAGAVIGRKAWQRLREHLTRKLTYTEKALNALANLQRYSRSKNAMKLEEWKKFSFELAGILRKFSDENFRMDSRDMTDREFLQELRQQQAAAPFVNLIGGILATITEVRYGRKELDSSVVPGLLLDARKFVDSTSVEPREGNAEK